jgi:hypothetical protein
MASLRFIFIHGGGNCFQGDASARKEKLAEDDRARLKL